MMQCIKIFSALLLWVCCLPLAYSQNFQPNYDESKVPGYELPDPLTFEDGSKVSGASDWPARRAEILELFENHVYGKMPEKPDNLSFEVRKEVPRALNGLAALKEVRIHVKNPNKAHHFDLLLFVPNKIQKPVPVFLGLNFNGNHTVHPSEHISVTSKWVRNKDYLQVTNHQANEASRGHSRDSYPVERVSGPGICFCNDLLWRHRPGL